MIWIVALLCLGASGLMGFYQGPVRGAFSLLGLIVGTFLASPLGHAIQPLLKAFGVKHPIWSQVIPWVIAFVAVVIVFRVIGSAIHQKVLFANKYGADDSRYYLWERVFQRLGLVVGLFCGAFYFFLIMVPVYVAGYFTLQLDSQDDAPATSRIVNNLRKDIQALKLDRVLAAYDPTPAQAYKAGDTAALILKNRLVENRLCHYPPFLSLAEQPEFKALGSDLNFHKLFATQASARQLLNYPGVQAVLTNNALLTEVIRLTGDNLDDLYDYLQTGKSAKYDSEKILGVWTINLTATMAQERKKAGNLSALQLSQLRMIVTSQVVGLSLAVTTDNQAVLKRETSGPAPAVIARGSWKKSGDDYQVTLPNSTPETGDVTASDDQLQLVRNGVTMVFERDL